MTGNISNDVSRKNNCPKLLTRALRCCIFAAEKHCGDTLPHFWIRPYPKKVTRLVDLSTCKLVNLYITITNLTKNDEQN